MRKRIRKYIKRFLSFDSVESKKWRCENILYKEGYRYEGRKKISIITRTDLKTGGIREATADEIASLR